MDDMPYQIRFLLATVLIVLLRVISSYLSDRDPVVVIGLCGESGNTTAHTRALYSFLGMCSFKNGSSDFVCCFSGSPSVHLLSETFKGGFNFVIYVCNTCRPLFGGTRAEIQRNTSVLNPVTNDGIL